MTELFQPMVVGPVLPATILLAVLMIWSLLTIAVGVGLDLQTPLHGHFESVSHAFWGAIGSVAMVPMKWLNLRNMPFMLWIGIFAIVWWCTSIGFWMVINDRFLSEPNTSPHWIITILLIVRNLVVALPLTKLFTQPMRGWFQTSSFESKSLIGKEAEISSYDASPDNGQVKFKTNGAPLLLNVRTDSEQWSSFKSVIDTYRDSPLELWHIGSQIVRSATRRTPEPIALAKGSISEPISPSTGTPVRSGSATPEASAYGSAVGDVFSEAIWLVIEMLQMPSLETGLSFEPQYVNAESTREITRIVGDHPLIQNGRLAIDYYEWMERMSLYETQIVPRFRALAIAKKAAVERVDRELKSSEFKAKVLTSFVRNQLIDQVYLPRVGDNLAKQIGSSGDNKRTDRMGLLLLVSPPGYGKTTLMEYVANRLGLVFVKVNGPALGHDVKSLDPGQAPQRGCARRSTSNQYGP